MGRLLLNNRGDSLCVGNIIVHHNMLTRNYYSRKNVLGTYQGNEYNFDMDHSGQQEAVMLLLAGVSVAGLDFSIHYTCNLQTAKLSSDTQC